jgi:hypothetical protein
MHERERNSGEQTETKIVVFFLRRSLVFLQTERPKEPYLIALRAAKQKQQLSFYYVFNIFIFKTISNCSLAESFRRRKKRVMKKFHLA